MVRLDHVLLLAEAAAAAVISTSPPQVTAWESDAVKIGAREDTFDVNTARLGQKDPVRKWCHLYQETYVDPAGVKWQKPALPGKGMEECNQQCGELKPHIARSCGYLGFSEYSWADDPTLGPGIQKAVAPCNCDDKDMALLSQGMVKVYAIVGEATCNVWVGILTGLIDFCINSALDTVEGAIKAVQALEMKDEHTKIVEAALGIRETIGDIDKSRSIFGKWVASKLCAKGALTQQQTDEMFDTIAKVHDIAVSVIPVGGAAVLNAFRFGSSVGKLGGEANDFIKGLEKLDNPKDRVDNPIGNKKDDPKTTNDKDKATPSTAGKGTDKTTEKPPDKTTDNTRDKTTDTAKRTTSACTRNKRAPGEQCAETTITSVINSKPLLTTITSTCNDASYTQACYHYYSAIKGGAKSEFTCSDYNSRNDPVANGVTSTWKKDHNNQWRRYLSKEETHCDADEWPPAFFLPDNYDGAIAEFGPWKQSMRLLPRSDNRGAGSHLWGGFCIRHDGGEGNGQFLKKAATPQEQTKPKDEAKAGPAKRLVAEDILREALSGKGSSNDADAIVDVNDIDVSDDYYTEPLDDEPLDDELYLESGQTDALLKRGRSKDGKRKGKDNQELMNAGLNPKLVDFKNYYSGTSSKDGTVTEYYTNVPFTRAVFNIDFSFTKKPTLENDWLLLENPCWPKEIVLDDPGYVLPLDDKWYETAALGQAAAATKALYRKTPPDAAKLAAVEKAAWDRGAPIRAAKKAEKEKAAEEKAEREKANKEKADKAKVARRGLSGWPWIKDELNITRPMTPEEFNREFRYVPPSIPGQNNAVPTSMITVVERQPAVARGSTPMLPTETGSLQ